jgi:hypothetical protein
MASVLDILISIIFGGALVVILLTATDLLNDNAAATYGERLVQESLIAVSQQVEGDFRNMGFAVPDSQQVILIAESTRVRFRIDLPPFGSVDTLTYSQGSPTELASTTNDQDCYLYRQRGSGPREVVGIVTNFGLGYLNSQLGRLTFPVPDSLMRSIRQIEINLEVQNPSAPYRSRDMIGEGERDALYSSIAWKQTRLVAENLDR